MKKIFQNRFTFLTLFSLLVIPQLNYSQFKEVVHPDWSKNIGVYEANVRQFTEEGTFAAFEKHLPRIKKLGVGILWFMPIHPIGKLNRKGTLGSYYSVKDYKAVNPEFGTLEEFKALVKKIHSMGMYVIIDWVANHSAWDNVWVKSHPDFYTKDDDGNFVPPVPDWRDVIDFDYSNKELWKYMIDAMKFWVEEADIDGFRCDVAAMVPTPFWNEARKELEKIKPVFMLAEANEPELQKYAFDMTYNWKLKDIFNGIGKGSADAEDIVDYYKYEKETYDENDYRMVFTTNHDENTWHGTVKERLGDGAEAFNVLIFLLPDMPLIYGGQEAGLSKRLDFFEKDKIDWSKFPYSEKFETLLALKKMNKALWNGNKGGEIKFLKNSDDEKILSFFREKDGGKIFALFNLSDEEINAEVETEFNGTFENLFSGKVISIKGDYSVELKPWEYQIFTGD
ncbi:MAG: alpha-amylase [Chlorobi bacterium]|nr:alpha-amylase [Chlorobiota bacterium]